MLKRLGLLLAMLFIAQGCGIYNSRYYYQDPPTPRCFQGVCITPRFFAYQNKPGDSLEWIGIDTFQVSFRITDGNLQLTKEDLNKTPEERRAEAAAFRERISSSFKIDSLVMWRRYPGMTRLAAFTHDTSRYTPQAANYMTIGYGYLCLPDTIEYLRAVMHLTRYDEGPTPKQDSATFDMLRKDYHGKGVQLFREDIRGYEE